MRFKDFLPSIQWEQHELLNKTKGFSKWMD